MKSIQELNSVRNLVRVVPKTAPSGSYTVRKGVAGKLYNTAEKEQIKELKNMEFDQIWYNVKKFAGFMPAPSELLNDSFVNFVREIVDWLSESAIVTENDEIFYGVGGEKNVEGIISSGKFKSIKAPSLITIKFLRKVKNQIKRGYRKNAKWVMNTEAFETLANIEDKNGRGILAEDPRNEDNFLLFGRPVEVYDEIVTDEKTQKHTFYLVISNVDTLCSIVKSSKLSQLMWAGMLSLLIKHISEVLSVSTGKLLIQKLPSSLLTLLSEKRHKWKHHRLNLRT